MGALTARARRRRTEKPPAIGAVDTGAELLDQHSDVVTRALPDGMRRSAKRVRTRLEALHDGGRIDTRHWAAGERFERDYLLGVQGVVDRESVRIPGSGDPAAVCGLTDAQADALAAWRDACGFLGPTGAELLTWFVVQDVSADEIARRISIHATAAQGAVWLALGNLADHYAAADKAARPKKR